MLGGGVHEAEVTLTCPEEQDCHLGSPAIVKLEAAIGTTETVMIPFQGSSQASQFRNLLKRRHDLRVDSFTTLHIPISFTPQTMKLHRSTCTVIATRLDGKPWDDTDGERVDVVRFIYPVEGTPHRSIPATMPATPRSRVTCEAQSHVEQTLQVTLDCVEPGDSGFTCSLDVPTRGRDDLQQAVAVKLLAETTNKEGTSVVLTLCVVFAPTRIFSHEVKLLVKSRAGAVWHFSLHLVATETSFDDVITMEAAGLARTSTVSFCLTSQTR
ncbi:PREDICTED: cilia- and flagella-associated protein 47-like [Priapulus caudatus]|uniref:Cilia- and flagella-associated protein 47-like n=1 Tax=Priapulus caudatus TaxID=37621 RepID=A0ABM1F1R7_PRICU|nr:PREDICTED: cilia- and flagella-associated protein 47-like [Priapulus caudatus]